MANQPVSLQTVCMGWMRTLLLGDVGNRLDIADAEQQIESVRRSNARVRNQLAGKHLEISKLRCELGRQKLAIEALTRFLISKGIIEEAQLEDFIAGVDAEDGEVDGRLSFDASTGQLRMTVPGRD